MTHLCPTYIIDDDEGIRDALSCELNALGVFSRSFATAGEFLAVSDTLEPGCVLADLSLPADGMAVLRHIEPTPERFRAVIISGSRDDAQTALATGLGALAWLEKPFAENVLLEAIGQACAQLSATSSTGNVLFEPDSRRVS